MKPEPPPYPRPVPTIDFEDYPVLPGTTVYTNDQDLDENARAAKRRRIEAHANAYLRGEGLFILSAGLRGPFDGGWKNPWATKSKKRKQVVDVEESPAKRARLLPGNVRQSQGLATPTTSDSKHQSVSKQENPFEKTIRSSEPPTNHEKVKSWLRRNSALPQESFAVPTSPTPKKRPSVAETNQSSKPIWTPTKQRITVNSQDVKAPLHQLTSRVADSFDTIIPPGPRPAQTHGKLQGVLTANDHFYHGRQSVGQSSGHRARRSSAVLEQPIRAEEAIISLKRRSEEPVHIEVSGQSLGQIPAHEVKQRVAGSGVLEVEPERLKTSAVLPESVPLIPENNAAPVPFLERKNELDAPEVKLKELDASINQQLQEHQQDHEEDTPRIMEPPATNGTSLPFYSTAVSEVQSMKLPPSAQHKPELQASTSNISSGALLPDVLVESKKTVTMARNSTDSNERTNMDIVLSLSSRQPHTSDDACMKTSVKLTDENNINLGRISPLQNSPQPAYRNFVVQQQSVKSPIRETNGNIRMSQTSLDGSIVRSPTSTQRNRSNKKGKKASFAAEPSFNSSHGSIKSVLKVQKLDVLEKVPKFTPPALSFSKSVDMDTSPEGGKTVKDTANAASPQNNSPVEVWKVPRRSILKSKSTHSSAAATLASAMLSPRNREGSSLSKASNQGIQPSGQNGVLPRQQEDDFDMEGALDDLGSFLSTWDAEKESVHAM